LLNGQTFSGGTLFTQDVAGSTTNSAAIAIQIQIDSLAGTTTTTGTLLRQTQSDGILATSLNSGALATNLIPGGGAATYFQSTTGESESTGELGRILFPVSGGGGVGETYQQILARRIVRR